MNDLNTVMIEGNLTHDPELKYLSTGTAKCSLSLGVNRSFRQNGEWKKEASFFDVVLWAKLAQYYAEKLTKGTRVRVIGSLKQERWQKDGKNYSRVLIIADRVDYWKRGGSDGTN